MHVTVAHQIDPADICRPADLEPESITDLVREIITPIQLSIGMCSKCREIIPDGAGLVDLCGRCSSIGKGQPVTAHQKQIVIPAASPLLKSAVTCEMAEDETYGSIRIYGSVSARIGKYFACAGTHFRHKLEGSTEASRKEFRDDTKSDLERLAAAMTAAIRAYQDTDYTTAEIQEAVVFRCDWRMASNTQTTA